jgi:hypothetical protein
VSDEARKMAAALLQELYPDDKLTALCELLLAADAWDVEMSKSVLGSSLSSGIEVVVALRNVVRACRKLGLVP